MRAQSRVSKALGKAVHRILEIRTVGPGVLDEPCLMELRTTRNQRGDQGRSHAAPHIAHEIYDSGDRVVLLRRNSDVSHKQDRNKQEPQPYNLRDAKQRRGFEANLKVDQMSSGVHVDV